MTHDGESEEQEEIDCHTENENKSIDLELPSRTPKKALPQQLSQQQLLEQDLDYRYGTEEVDGGYGWIVVIAVFFVHVFVLGNFYSFGIFYPAYVDYFNGGAAEIAWIGSIGAALMSGIGIYTGKFADYYGNNKMVAFGGVLIAVGFLLASFATQIWELYITQGFIAGIGYSCSFIGGVSVVGQWFTKNRGLAVGIAVAGSGLGQFAISLITGNLIDSYGWRTALRVLAIIEFVGLGLAGWLIRRNQPLVKTWAQSQSSLIYFQDKNFNLLFFSGLLVSLGYLFPFTYIPAYSEQYKISNSNAVLLVSMIGIASAVGRISTGFLADRFGKLIMLQLCYLGSGLSTLSWLICWDFTSILVMGLSFGFFVGGVISLLPSVAAELYGVERLASILGVLYSCTAIGNLLSAPIGGFLLQGYDSYGPPIIASACFQMSSLFLVAFVNMKDNKFSPFTSPTDSSSYNEVQVELPHLTRQHALETMNTEEFEL